jgi:hypothetical protein
MNCRILDDCSLVELAIRWTAACGSVARAKEPSLRYTAGMGILIGMDEAGYGPNLGPLVVAGYGNGSILPGDSRLAAF